MRRIAPYLVALFWLAMSPASALPYRVAIVSLASTARPVRVHVTFGPSAAAARATSAPVGVYAGASTPPPLLPPVHGHVGDRRSFWVQFEDPTGAHGAETWARVSARLEYTTEHTDLWVDDDMIGLMDARFEVASHDAEISYLSQRDRFGYLSYTDADLSRHPKVPACNAKRQRYGMVPAYLPSRGELLSMLIVAPGKTRSGYADVSSFTPDAHFQCSGDTYSNNLPGLIIVAMTDRTTDPSDDELLVAPAHELQHLKNYIRHKIRGVSSGMQMSLLNEGLSVVSQDFASATGRNKAQDEQSELLAMEYLRDPNAVSLMSFFYRDGAQSHPFGVQCYGGAYLLQYYFYKRFGDSYLDRVTDTQEDGLRAMADALPVPLPDAMREFGGFILEGTRKEILRAIPGSDFTLLGGSVSLYSSDEPIASITSQNSSVVWVAAPDV